VRDADGFAGEGQGVDGFVEEDWVFGDRKLGFGGVAGVVEAEAADCGVLVSVEGRGESVYGL